MSDDKKIIRNRHRGTLTRHLVQLYSALLYNAHLKGFVEGEIYQGRTKAVCVPGLNCYSCPGAVGACPLGSIQNALSSAGHRAGWYVAGIMLLYGVILGRTVCGWLCPLGLIQELLHKIPTPKIVKSAFTRALSWLKYIILAIFVIAVPLWYGLSHDLPLPAFCKYICPAGTFEGAIGLMPGKPERLGMFGLFFTRKFVIMMLIFLACIFIYRSFCRFLCPLGAIYGLFNRFNVIGIKVNKDLCNHCGACVSRCKMDVAHVGDHECINCGKCMEYCAKGAISFKAGKITLMAPQTAQTQSQQNGAEKKTEQKRFRTKAIIWGIALAVLAAAFLWYNTPDRSSHYLSDAPIGHEVGRQLEDFTAECFDGSTFHLADTRGKVTFINLWATYCAPCIQELPYFSDFLKEHEGDAAVLAVHSSLVVKDDPAGFIADKGYAMPFTTDTPDNAIFNIVGGSSTLPQTIVLNRRGEVVYNETKSVTPEMLEALYEKADKS